MYRPMSTFCRMFMCGMLILLLLPAMSRAEMWSATGTGSDGPLSATANFSFSDGQLTVTLTNNLLASVIRSNGQGLSDISFTLSNSPGTLGTTSASGQFGNIASDGKVSYTSSDQYNGDTSPLRWLGQGAKPNGQGNTGYFDITGNTITMETVGGGGGATQMIAPYIADQGAYTNANSGMSAQNSWVIGPATFTLSLSGVTKDTTITAATFSFGTGPDTFLTGYPGGPQPPANLTPAPPSIVMLGFGGLGLALAMVRSRRRLAPAM